MNTVDLIHRAWNFRNIDNRYKAVSVWDLTLELMDRINQHFGLGKCSSSEDFYFNKTTFTSCEEAKAKVEEVFNQPWFGSISK